MNTKRIGFIGGGRVTLIFLEGWKRGGALPAKIVVSDCNAETLAKLKAQFPGVETAPGNSAAAATQDIVFLAVHPPVMAEVVTSIRGSLKSQARWCCRSHPNSPLRSSPNFSADSSVWLVSSRTRHPL